jgi:sulfite exporter TauE/SafE
MSIAIARKRLLNLTKQATPLVLMGGLSAVHCFAAASPLAKLFQDVSAEATTTWAVAFAGIGLVIGLIGLKLADNQSAKSYLAGLAVVCFMLLSVQGIITYLQGE